MRGGGKTWPASSVFLLVQMRIGKRIDAPDSKRCFHLPKPKVRLDDQLLDDQFWRNRIIRKQAPTVKIPECGDRSGLRERTKRDFSTAQTDTFAGAKVEEKASVCFGRNDKIAELLTAGQY